jgi:transcription elongation factor Elf1
MIHLHFVAGNVKMLIKEESNNNNEYYTCPRCNHIHKVDDLPQNTHRLSQCIQPNCHCVKFHHYGTNSYSYGIDPHYE